jgi:DNA-binding transcriptional MerR regulator
VDDEAMSRVVAGDGWTVGEAAERLGGERRLPPDAVDRLRAIWRLRGEGLAPADIRQQLAGGTQGDPLQRLLAQLDRLHAELQRSEARRVEDRDRLMMALVRTQQEIQHLRYELSAARSRKERRRGFWARLFG